MAMEKSKQGESLDFVEPVKLDRGPFLTDPILTANLVARAAALLEQWDVKPLPPISDPDIDGM